jgi:small subunit ribosomal protein S5
LEELQAMADIQVPAESEEPGAAGEREQRPRGRGRAGGRGRGGGRGRESREGREPREGQSREESDLVDRLVSINRVAKVVKGGRRFAFAALVVVGDGKGRVGYGTGKAREVPEAIRKATDQAKRAMIRVPLRDRRTLHHDLVGRFGAGRVVLRAADPGTGIIAGGPMRAVFETMGVHDVVAKSVGSANPHNMVKATFAALKSMMSPRVVAARRGKKVGDLVGRRGEAGPGDKD